MKINQKTTLTLLATLTLLLTVAFTEGFTKLKLKAETNHSTLLFSVPISNGITRVTGKFNDYAIELDFSEEDISQTTLKAIINAESLDTGISDRDEHLRSKDFFDTETYPQITFESTAITQTDEGMMVTGVMDFHGVKKSMTIPLKITGRDGPNTIGFQSRFVVKRSDFNLASDFQHTSMENFIGDEISVELDFWTKKRKDKKE
ncbi:MAG: YceI family protein [Flavobacteriaceae bacterium]|nr:YceI family protein [Flavobacteriaceae bacterium]